MKFLFAMAVVVAFVYGCGLLGAWFQYKVWFPGQPFSWERYRARNALRIKRRNAQIYRGNATKAANWYVRQRRMWRRR